MKLTYFEKVELLNSLYRRRNEIIKVLARIEQDSINNNIEDYVELEKCLNIQNSLIKIFEGDFKIEKLWQWIKIKIIW